MDVKVSRDKNARWVDRENLIYVRWNRIKNRAQRQRRWSIKEEEVRHSEVKPVENISKNLHSFLEINPEQKEVLPSHKLQDHSYEYWNPFESKEDNLSREITRINLAIQVCLK